MLSNPILVVTIVISVSLVIFGLCLVGFGFMVKKGKNPEKYLKKADTIIDDAQAVTDVADKIIPNNPAINVLETVLKSAHFSAAEAEQLCVASKLPPEERNAKAKETIYATLNFIGVQRTPEIDKIIDGALEAECLALGHKKTTEQKTQANTAEPSGATVEATPAQ